jgi:ACS family allantoate permease-like MFS transporter
MSEEYSDQEKEIASVHVTSINNNFTELDTIISPSGKIIHIAHDDAHLDEALAFAREHGHIEVSEQEDKKVRRKLDMIIMPLFCFLYMNQFMDKTGISFAAVMGIQPDYHMKGQMYSWTNSAFYLGYLFGAPFAAVLLPKVPTIKFVSCVIIIWGLIQCLHCVPRSYAAFMFLRTFLGFLESFVAPIFIIILNQYYRHSEHFGRTGIFYGFNGMGSIFLGAVSYALYTNNKSYSLESYKILFLIIGLMTILNGFLILFIMPNTPIEAKWLSEREKEVIIERIRDNNQGYGNKIFKWEQAREVLKDPRSYIYLLLSLSVAIPNGGISGFGTIIIKSFGFSTEDALLYKMPVGAFELVALAGLPIITRFIKSRMIIAISYCAVILSFICVLAFSSNDWAALVGYWVFGISPVGIILITSCITSNTAGFTKKMITTAIMLCGYSAGNVIGPQTFRTSDAPDYNNAKAGAVGCYCATIVLMIILTWYNIRENKKRDKQRAALGDKYIIPDNVEFADLTDFQNPEFRYRV